jgi:hypothetical protein
MIDSHTHIQPSVGQYSNHVFEFLRKLDKNNEIGVRHHRSEATTVALISQLTSLLVTDGYPHLSENDSPRYWTGRQHHTL